MSNEEQDLIEKFIQKTGGFARDMTLRDYFAAKVMQGAISGMAVRHETFSYSECAALSYEMADAMLKAREA